MRRVLLTFGPLGIVFAWLAAGDDAGVLPRATPTGYPVHDNVKAAVLAAAVIPPEQVKKLFSADIAKHYVVVEVAVYPEDGRTFEVDLFDFELRTGDRVLHASKPRDVASPWPEKRVPYGGQGPTVVTETGVIVARGADPATGRPRTSVGTYEGVGVSNYPSANDPMPPQGSPDQAVVEAKVRRMALPLGSTSTPVAGYLYFGQTGRKHEPLTLNYSRDDQSVDLKFPK